MMACSAGEESSTVPAACMSGPRRQQAAGGSASGAKIGMLRARRRILLALSSPVHSLQSLRIACTRPAPLSPPGRAHKQAAGTLAAASLAQGTGGCARAAGLREGRAA